jgi:hypothetical protein
VEGVASPCESVRAGDRTVAAWALARCRQLLDS